MEGKGCQFGESCSFAHGHSEIRNVQMNLAALNPNYKGTLCKYFMTTGECEFGSICQYAHGNMVGRRHKISPFNLDLPSQELRRNPSMGGMGGGGNQHLNHMGGGGNQNFSHMGGGGPASPQWKTTLCKNYQEDGRFVKLNYAALAMRSQIWDLVLIGTRLLKWSQKGPNCCSKDPNFSSTVFSNKKRH